jgi:hypothetical protein
VETSTSIQDVSMSLPLSLGLIINDMASSYRLPCNGSAVAPVSEPYPTLDSLNHS